QELRIGRHVEQLRIRAVPLDDLAHPFAGVHGHGAFFYDDCVVIDRSRDLPRHRLDVRKVGVAAIRWRSAYRDKYRRTGTNCRLQIVGEGQPLPMMARQQLRQELLMNGHMPRLQRRKLFVVVIDYDDVMTKIRKTGPRDQPDISRTHNRNAPETAPGPAVDFNTARSLGRKYAAHARTHRDSI